MKKIQTSNIKLFMMGKLLKLNKTFLINRPLTVKERGFLKKINAIIENNRIKINNTNFELIYTKTRARR